MAPWPTVHPRPIGPWTMSRADGAWAILEPECGTVTPIDPADDAALPALAPALERGRLIGYRAGRRAVISTGSSYVKILRPRRMERVRCLHQLVPSSDIRVPEVLASSTTGALELAPIGGTSLHARLRGGQSPLASLRTIGRSLAALHATPPSAELQQREQDSPARWIDTVARAEVDARPDLERVAAELPPLASLMNRPASVVHGDLHDKNVFTSGGDVGLIDLDSLGIGPAETDLGNLGVHLRLRALQAGQSPTVGDRHAGELYEAYAALRPLDCQALAVVERHTWFRLSCLYRFRAGSRPLVPELLRRARG